MKQSEEKSKRIIKQIGNNKIVIRELKPPTVVNNNKDKEPFDDKSDDSKSSKSKIEEAPIIKQPTVKINENKPQETSEEIDLEESDSSTENKQSGK